MAHCLQAEKRARQACTRQSTNLAVKRRIKTQINKVLDSVTQSRKEEARLQLSEAARLLDQAAQKGILHPKNGRRRLSRLALKIQKMASEPGLPPSTQ